MSHLSNDYGKYMMIDDSDYKTFRASTILSWVLVAFSVTFGVTLFGGWIVTLIPLLFWASVACVVTFCVGLWLAYKYHPRFSELRELRILIDSWHSVLNNRYTYGKQIGGSYSFFDGTIVVQRRGQGDWFVQIRDEHGDSVLDMVIVKYVIYADEETREILRTNPVKRDLIESALSSLKTYVNFNESLEFAARLAANQQIESIVNYNR